MLGSILIHVDSKALRLERLIRPTLYITHVICLASQHWQKEDCAFLSCFFFLLLLLLPGKVMVRSKPIYLPSLPVYPRLHASLQAQQFSLLFWGKNDILAK